MAVDEFSVPAHVTKKLKELGYVVDTSMDTYIQSWFDWYSGKDDWYRDGYTDLQGRRRTRNRMSIRPAKRVASEWASLLITDDTQVSVEADAANKWLQGWLDRANFWPTGQMVVEKAFALGTAAWALWLETLESSVSLEESDPLLARYLSGDVLPSDKRGWTLVQADGLSLGWAKGDGQQLKNHYPKALRRL